MTTPYLGMAVHEPHWPTATMFEGCHWAAEFSAYDPDQHHPAYVMALLRVSFSRTGESNQLARTLPEVEAIVQQLYPNAAPVVGGAHVTAPVKRTVPQLELDLFSATGMEPEPTEQEALAAALQLLADATAAKGKVPSMDDCHRKRYGLPGMEAFRLAGGWHQVMVRFRAAQGGVA